MAMGQKENSNGDQRFWFIVPFLNRVIFRYPVFVDPQPCAHRLTDEVVEEAATRGVASEVKGKGHGSKSESLYLVLFFFVLFFQFSYFCLLFSCDFRFISRF